MGIDWDVLSNESILLNCFVLIPLFLIGCAQMEKIVMKSASTLSPGQHSQAFEKTVTKTMSCKYLLFLPEGYGKKQQRWPMILFLHGAGERGNDLKKVKEHGLPKIVEKQKDSVSLIERKVKISMELGELKGELWMITERGTENL